MAPSCSRPSWLSTWWRHICAQTAQRPQPTPTRGQPVSRWVPLNRHRCSAGVHVPAEHHAAQQVISKTTCWHCTKAAPTASLRGVLSFRLHWQLPEQFPGPQSGRRMTRLHPPLPPAAAGCWGCSFPPCATPWVQVRQHREHKRTFMYLEQLILRYNAAGSCLAIKEIHEASNGLPITPPVHGCASPSMLSGAALSPTNHMRPAPATSPAACALMQMWCRRHTASCSDRLSAAVLTCRAAVTGLASELCSSWVLPATLQASTAVLTCVLPALPSGHRLLLWQACPRHQIH